MVGEPDVAALAGVDAVPDERHVEPGDIARERIETDILQVRGADRGDRAASNFAAAAAPIAGMEQRMRRNGPG